MTDKTMTAKTMHEALAWLAKLDSPLLTAQQQQDFFEWLEAAPEHQAAYLKAEQLWLRGDVFERLNQGASAPIATDQVSHNTWWAWGSGLAACAVIFFAYIVLGPLMEAPLEQGRWQYATAIGEQKNITLPDGSELILNTDTKIDVLFNEERRMASLAHGEVFFAVAPEGARPFDVVTSAGSVRVLGTRFSVQRLRASKDASVTVVEGRVALNPEITTINTIPAFKSRQILSANQLSSMVATTLGLLPVNIDAANALAWRQQRLIFKAQPLADVIAELNRYSPLPISLGQPSLAGIEVTAVLPLNNIGRTVQALAESVGLGVENQAKAYVLMPVAE